MPQRPIGIIVQLVSLRRYPLVVLLKSSIPICSPTPKNIGRKQKQIKSERVIAVCTCSLNSLVFFAAKLVESSGMSAVAYEPIIEFGNASSGMVMPRATPNKLMACSAEKPAEISLNGSSTAISG